MHAQPVDGEGWMVRALRRLRDPFRRAAPEPAPTAPVTPSLMKREPAGAPIGRPGRNEEQRLDEALQETMPTSDPVSIRIE